MAANGSRRIHATHARHTTPRKCLRIAGGGRCCNSAQRDYKEAIGVSVKRRIQNSY